MAITLDVPRENVLDGKHYVIEADGRRFSSHRLDWLIDELFREDIIRVVEDK